MHNLPENILSDHQDQFAEIFSQIAELINNDELDKALEIIKKLHYADLADFLDNTNYKTYKAILPFLKDDIKPETLVSLSVSNKQPVIEILGIEKSAQLINQLDIEDAIEVIVALDVEIKQLILNNLSSEKQQQIIEGCTYANNSVGRVIERQFVCFQKYWTVKHAIEYIRHKRIKLDIHAAIVIDNKYRPVGTILLSTLLQHNENNPIQDLMNPEFKIADIGTELSELSFVFKQYALTIVPVVNKSGKLVGTVSIDKMIYIIAQQTEKDIMSLGGLHTRDTFYNLFYTAKYRFPWLFMHLITACIISIIINHFSATIEKRITLVSIMPILASLSGSAGTQAMTVTVRALANKEIHYKNILKVIAKEVPVCGFNGFILACIGAPLSFVILLDSELSIIFAIAVFFTLIVAGFFGAVIPITLHYLDIDPAVGSGVCLTTITDALGFFILLALASHFLIT